MEFFTIPHEDIRQILGGFTMGRPKGSKNKKKCVTGASIDELIAQRLEAKAALEEEFNAIKASMEEQATRARAIKADVKKLVKELEQLYVQKEAEEAAAKEAAAREVVQNKVSQLMAEGKSLEEIMSMLR